MQKLNLMPIIRLSYLGMLLSLPLAASAVDNPLIKGYCGPPPPNSWFEFSSSAYADVKAQLISTLTQHAFADYPRCRGEVVCVQRRRHTSGKWLPNPASCL